MLQALPFVATTGPVATPENTPCPNRPQGYAILYSTPHLGACHAPHFTDRAIPRRTGHVAQGGPGNDPGATRGPADQGEVEHAGSGRPHRRLRADPGRPDDAGDLARAAA